MTKHGSTINMRADPTLENTNKNQNLANGRQKNNN